MNINDIRTALSALVHELFPSVKTIPPDEREPVVRPSFRIDVLPMGGGAACGGAPQTAEAKPSRGAAAARPPADCAMGPRATTRPVSSADSACMP